MPQFPVFDVAKLESVRVLHPELRSVKHQRKAGEGEAKYAHGDRVAETADWENVKATLEEFHPLIGNVEVLNRGLLSLINAARPLGFATALAKQASLLRGYLADLFFFIRHYIHEMQQAWFNHKDFDQFTKTPSANLVLHHPDPRDRTSSFRDHIDRVSKALESLDNLAASVVENANELVPLFKPLKDHLDTAVLPKPEGNPHNCLPTPADNPRNCLPILIQACNNWMRGMTAVLEQWSEIEIPSLIVVQSHQREVLQNISTVAALFSGVSATTLQYSTQLQPPRFITAFNFLWLLSLLLSTASAIQCQLAIYWHTSSKRRTPKDTFWLLSVGASEVPLTMLGTSSVAFVIGLAYFAFVASNRHNYVAIGTTAAICLIGVAVFTFITLLLLERKLSQRA